MKEYNNPKFWLFHATLISVSLLVGLLLAINPKGAIVVEMTVRDIVMLIVATITCQAIIAMFGWIASMFTFKKIVELKMDFQKEVFKAGMKVTNNKLDVLFDKVGEHNKFASRLAVLESKQEN